MLLVNKKKESYPNIMIVLFECYKISERSDETFHLTGTDVHFDHENLITHNKCTIFSQ